ncbi:hypothetical protein GCM10023086_72270 [Streptomyces venetus]|uniref:Uncharacterized protein n=1 Tax=Streptomyces venetus TaxID=1701086 RepID=A0ABP8HE41_9ACTN
MDRGPAPGTLGPVGTRLRPLILRPHAQHCIRRRRARHGLPGRGRPPVSSSAANPATVPAWVEPVTELAFEGSEPQRRWRFQGPVMASMMPGVWMLA